LTTTREKLTAAAFELFEAQGYEQTTIDDITARAGVGRTTFFRTFRTKDEVIFPDHEHILTATRDHLTRTRTADPVRAARDAVVFVLRQHLQKPDVARSRYRLTSVVPALRDREISSTSDYQRLFYEHFRDVHPSDALQAELLAAACVTVHNHILRRWLRDPFTHPEAQLARQLDAVLARLSAGGPAVRSQPTEIAVLRTTRPLEDVLPALRDALDGTTPAGPRSSD
jgi:AcrR family transcriptional regulator